MTLLAGPLVGTITVRTGTGAAVVLFLALFAVVFAAVEVVAAWRLFTKAGRPGVAAIVPIYNAYVLVKIAGRPGWWFFLYFVPLVDLVVAVVVLYELSKRFGHGGGYAAGLLLLGPIFVPILAFGTDRYLGPRPQQRAAQGLAGASTGD